jgi:exocyst complex component 4
MKYDWPQILSEDANPIEMAVSLLDDTSVGMAHKLDEFENLRQQTSTALRQVVNDKYELFNNSVSSYHLMLPLMDKSQQDANSIKKMLQTTTSEIHTRSDTLNELNTAATKINETIDILDAIEEINAIPDKIDQLVADKKVHQVYDVIANAYKQAEKYKLWSLGALSGIQNYLDSQSNSLFDMIIDELQNEIYLKSSIGDISESHVSWLSLMLSNNPQLGSFKNLINESHTLEQFIYNSANLDTEEIAEVITKPFKTFVTEQLPKIHDHYSKQQPEVDYSIILDAGVSANSDSFSYIYLLLNTASKLGRLQQVMELLTTRTQLELQALINRCTEQIKLKHVFVISKLSNLQSFDHGHDSDILGDIKIHDSAVIILQDLFGSIFVQCLAVLQRHKLVSEVVKILEGQNKVPTETGSQNGKLIHPAPLSSVGSTAIASPKTGSPKIGHPTIGSPREGSPATVNTNPNVSNYLDSNYSFREVWSTFKRELQALIVNYIHDISPIVSDNTNLSLMKQTSKVYDVMKRRDMFKFDDLVPSDTAKSSEDLYLILQDMFPGFTIGEAPGTTGDNSNSPYIKNESTNYNIDVIVPRDLFNMRIILEFFLIFIAGSHKLFQNNSEHKGTDTPINKTALQYFEDFMKISFLSQIREKMDVMFRENIASSIIYHQDHSKPTASHVVGFKLDTIDIAKDAILNNNPLTSNTSGNKSHIIYRNAYDFKRIFLNICSIFNTSLNYRAEYCGIVLNFLDHFALAYDSFYKELISIDDKSYTQYGTTMQTSNKPVSQVSKWLKTSSLTEVSKALVKSLDDTTLIYNEISIMLYGNGDLRQLFAISKEDLLDTESFDQVCYLLLTSTWILTWLLQLKKESNYEFYLDQSDDLKVSAIDKLKYDWSFLENGKTIIDTNSSNVDINKQNIFLALTSEKAIKFNEVIEHFRWIRDDCLLSLRYDLRCKCLFYIGKSITQNDWFLSSEPGDADRFISMLNSEIYSMNNHLQDIFSQQQRDGIYVGLGEFINKVLIEGSEQIEKINANGVKRIMLNIFILQQLLRNLLSNPETVDFTRSSAYFAMFTLNDNVYKEKIKQNEYRFTAQEYKNMTRLIYSEKLADGKGSSFNKSKYNDLIKLIETQFA